MRPIIFSPPLAVGVLLLSALLPSISTGCDISSHVEHRHASRGGRTGSGGATATTAYCCASLTRVGRRRVIPENASRSCGTGSRSTAAVEMRRASSGGSSDNADRGRPRWVPGSGIEKQQRRRQQQQQQAAAGVSRAFNRVVGSILSKGDMFGSLGGGGGVGIGSRNNFSRGAGECRVAWIRGGDPYPLQNTHHARSKVELRAASARDGTALYCCTARWL